MSFPRGGGLILLLAAVVAGVSLQVAFLPHDAAAVHSSRLAPARVQAAAVGTSAASVSGRSWGSAAAPVAPPVEPPWEKTEKRAERRAATGSVPSPPRSAASSPPRTTRSRLGLAVPLSESMRPSPVPPSATRGVTPVRAAVASRPIPSPMLPPAHEVYAPAPEESGGQRPEDLEELEDATAMAADETAGEEDDAPAGVVDREDDLRGAGPSHDSDRGGAKLLVLGPASARQGDLVIYSISVEGAHDVAHTPIRVTFDPQILEYVEAQEGPMLSADGAATQFQSGRSEGNGIIDVIVSRGRAGGISGSGVVLTVTFLARSAGESPILVAGSSLLDATGRKISFRGEDSHLAVHP